ncbi:PEP-CTERM sorting domain-containing protein [Massilia niastensis]|uniref:PEP-CTERM sorting domain-containing protein n=1 Tax=Massilia niastensis TaxID=544911 RepID=UPI001B7FDD6E|nr:PEP-CTERM sorting domain-containing protein [Massilia niastensis]
MKRLIGAATLALGVCGAAQANIITDTFNPSDVKITTSKPYEYKHDLSGEDLSDATVEWAKLSVVLRDPSLNFLETVTFNFEGEQKKVVKNVDWKGEKYQFGLLTSLLDDGILNVKISVGCTNLIIICLPQDVWFDRSTLKIKLSHTDPNPTPVPEPATLLSLGAGLLGLSAARRRAARRGRSGQGA